MQKHQDALEKTRGTLLEMGYSPEIIQLAFKEANSPSVEHILDLLRSREATYEYIIQRVDDAKLSRKSQNKKKGCGSKEEDGKNEARYKKSDDSTDIPERKPLTKVENQPPRDEERTGTSSKDQASSKKSENQAPQLMDELTNKYVDSILYYVGRIRAKDPNWMIIELSDQLKSLKFKTSEGGVRTRNYLEMPGHFPKLVELKHVIYSAIRRMLEMKVNKKFRVNVAELGNVLMMAFELGLIKPSYMQTAQTLYSRFCNRLIIKPDEEVLAKLELIYRESGGDQGEDEDLNLAGEVNDDIRVEGANENADKEDDDEPHMEPQTEKEFCILCMERVREVVFMPCCHFLACPTCSPKVTNCPVCKEVVQKYLKLYWS